MNRKKSSLYGFIAAVCSVSIFVAAEFLILFNIKNKKIKIISSVSILVGVIFILSLLLYKFNKIKNDQLISESEVVNNNTSQPISLLSLWSDTPTTSCNDPIMEFSSDLKDSGQAKTLAKNDNQNLSQEHSKDSQIINMDKDKIYQIAKEFENQDELFINYDNIEKFISKDEEIKAKFTINDAHNLNKYAKKINEKYSCGRTLLMKAVLDNNYDLCKLILSESECIDISILDNNNLNVLDLLNQCYNDDENYKNLHSLFLQHIDKDKYNKCSLEEINRIIDNFINDYMDEAGNDAYKVNKKLLDNGYTYLNLATISDDIDLIGRLLKIFPCLLYQKNFFGETPLIFSLKHNKSSFLIQECNEMNPIINDIDNDGKTALHYAVENQDEFYIKVLFGCEKIDYNIEDKNGQTPLSIAQINHYDSIENILNKEIQKKKGKEAMKEISDFFNDIEIEITEIYCSNKS